MDTSISGLASGFDWSSFIEQMAAAERTPQTRLRTEKTQIQSRNSAYSSLKTQLEALKAKMDVLKESSLYSSRKVTSSDETVAAAEVSTGAIQGSFTFQINQLAKAASWTGTTNVAKAIDATKPLSEAGFSTAITAGTFSINGVNITVESTDTLDTIMGKINADSSIGVTAAYSPDAENTDKIKLTSTNGKEIMLGSSGDTSNFLQVTQLNSYSTDKMSVSSTNQLGTLDLSSTLASANFATAVQGGATTSKFKINGVEITYDASTDKLSDILSRINNSSAGVMASYDVTNDRISLTNKKTGDVGFVLEEKSDGSEGNFLAAAGLTTGTLSRGSNLTYSINGGGQLVSQTNTITESSSGIKGLSVTALKANSTVQIDVNSDTDKVKTAITDFITQYNKVQGYIDTQTAITVTSGKVSAGVLSSDSEAGDIASRLRSISFSTMSVSGSVTRLSDLGINGGGYDNNLTQSDTTSLDELLENNLGDLEKFFSDETNGWAVGMSDYLDKLVKDDGVLETKQTTLNKQSTDIDTQIAEMEKTVLAHSEALKASFVAMETAQAKINQQMQYITGLSTTKSS